MGDRDGLEVVFAIIILGIIFLIAVKEITRPRTYVEEIVRDEQGRIVQVIRKVM